MQQQQPHATVIFVGGPCGSGKSHVGRELASRIGYEFIEGDEHHSEGNKRKMAAGMPLQDNDRLPWLHSLAGVWQTNPQGHFVIACSALKRKYREILLGNKPAEERVVVMLSVPKEILKRRVDKRQGHYAKSVLIDSQLSTLELPATDEQQHREPNLLIVDGTLPVTDVVNSIIKRLHFGEN